MTQNTLCMRTIFCCLLLISFSLLVGSTPAAEVQERVYRIGFLLPRDATSHSGAVAQFLIGLNRLGYEEGQNIIIEYRYAEGKFERFTEFTRELLADGVQVIVAASSRAARAAQEVSKSIPIVLTDSADPVRTGLVASLARPGGNITGSTFMSRELSAKRLELLTEIVPGASRISVLSSPTAFDFEDLEAVAASHKINLEWVRVAGADDFQRAFMIMNTNRSDGFVLITNPLLSSHRVIISTLATNYRLPGMYTHKRYVEAGGLMSYGADHGELYQRAAYFVDRILKGTKPADLPVERPMRAEFAVNLKAANEIGFTFPPEVLQRADMVIK
jgi:ABC-type uncharacterized transport system substrate-binding protein